MLLLFSTAIASADVESNVNRECVVLLCNKAFFPKFLYTLNLLTTNGKYHGDICLVIGDDLLDNKLLNDDLLKNNNVIIKHFPDLQFPLDFIEMAKNLDRPFFWFEKLFQYHKLHLFNTYFKKWDTIFYIDCGVTIFSDIRPILNTREPDLLLAHSDAYPTYQWKLHVQFDKSKVDFYNKLNSNFNLNIDYFQTTCMLYDSNIIEENTFEDLYNLTLTYPISRTNDQGIISLYFTNIVPIWKQIPLRNENTFFYDYMKRGNDKYIMTKM